MSFGRKKKNGAHETDGAVDELRGVLRGRAPDGMSDPKGDRRLVTLRHRAGIELMDSAAPAAAYPDPAAADFPANEVPTVGPSELSPELIRAAILSHGCVLVRGALERGRAEEMARSIDALFAERDARVAGHGSGDLYEEFQPDGRFNALEERPWIAKGGGVLAVDSPPLLAEMLGAFERIGLSEAIRGYLGEPSVISAQKTTMRKAAPDVPGAWHQDGNFMGDVRSLNVWLSLSRCGDVAPGLDLIPRRIDYLIPAGTDGAPLSYVIAPGKVEEAAAQTPILRPIFEPGDALLFDHWFVHQTGSDPSMPNPRYAIESWFFAASSIPEGFAPLAV